MNDEYTLILHDLLILEEIASNMASYLDSDVSDWTIPRVNMPKLTIGGYLMRVVKSSYLGARLGRYYEEQEQRHAARVELLLHDIRESILRLSETPLVATRGRFEQT